MKRMEVHQVALHIQHMRILGQERREIEKIAGNIGKLTCAQVKKQPKLGRNG